MKNILYSLALLGLLFTACGEEFEEVNKENLFPITQSLINAYVEGTVSNLKGQPLDSIRVDLLVDGEILASTITEQGFYFFIDVAAHETKSVIRAHSKQYAPNFKSVKFDDEYSSQVKNITIDQFMLTKEQANLTAILCLYTTALLSD